MSVISPYHSGNSCLNFRYSFQLSALLSPTSISFFTLSELPLSDGRLKQTHLSMQAADCSMRHWKVIKGLCGGLEPIIGGWMPQPLLGGVVAGWPVTPSFTGLVRESGDLSTLCVVPQWWNTPSPSEAQGTTPSPFFKGGVYPALRVLSLLLLLFAQGEFKPFQLCVVILVRVQQQGVCLDQRFGCKRH